MAKQIFLFYGDEDLLIEEKVNQLKEGIGSTLNVEQIDAEEPDLERITSALQTQPLLFGEKLIIFKNVDLRSDFWNEVAPTLESIPSGTRVVFWASSISKRSKIYKRIDEIGEACEFRSFAAWEQDQVVSWITRRVQALGKEIDHQAAVALHEICGSGLRKLSCEIDKIITYAGERRRVAQEDVKALASPGQTSVFALSDALAEKDLERSLSTFRILQKNRFEMFPMLSMLANCYRIMLLAKTQRDPMRIAQILKASPYYVRKCMARAGRFTQEELIGNLELIQETDIRLKSGGSQVITFELLLVSLCGK